MAEIPAVIKTWQMVQPTVYNKETKESTPGKLALTEIPVPELKPGEVLVEVAGCGVCHTDLGYFYDGVPTVSKPPLTLGHEIAGTVVAGDKAWMGKEVIIPAVMPCRQCYPVQNRPRQPLSQPENAGEQPGPLRWFFQPYPGAEHRSLRSEEPGRLPPGPPVRRGRCRHHPLSGRQAGRLSAGGQRDHRRDHRRRGTIYGADGQGPGREDGRRHRPKRREITAGAEVRGGSGHQLQGQGCRGRFQGIPGTLQGQRPAGLRLEDL